MGKIIAGSFLVLLGASILLEQPPFNIWGLNFGNIFSLFWVVIGILLLQRRKLFWGFMFAGFGFVSFVSGFFDLDLGAWFIPLVFIVLGLSIIFRSSTPHTTSGSDQDDLISEAVIFGALEKQYDSKNFKGGKVDCIFAGMKLDLSKAKIAKEGAELEVNAIFGGGEIIVPKDMKISSNGTGVFGGWTNKFESDTKPNEPVLRIKGAAVFGGVEVKN